MGVGLITHSSAQGRGRPPRLTVERLMAGANALGLETLTMKSLAAHLGVGIATVYRFASSKEELVRMATVARTQRSGFTERPDQDWAQFVTAFGRELRAMYIDEPQLIALMVGGGIGPEIEAQTLDHFIGALAKRGIEPQSAMQLYHAIGALALGSAVVVSHNRALQTTSRPRMRELERISAEGGFTFVAENLDVIGELEAEAGFEDALDALVTGFRSRFANEGVPHE